MNKIVDKLVYNNYECDFLLTTDKRQMKYNDDFMKWLIEVTNNKIKRNNTILFANAINLDFAKFIWQKSLDDGQTPIDLSYKDRNNANLLMIYSSCNLEMVEWLYDLSIKENKPFNLNDVDNSGNTAIDYAKKLNIYDISTHNYKNDLIEFLNKIC